MIYYDMAFSGGGAKGAAHVGALKLLEQRGIMPGMVAGTSSGAIIAGLIACGYSAAEIEEISMDIAKLGRSLIDPFYGGFLSLMGIKRPGKATTLDGLIKGNRLYAYFKKIYKGKRMRDAVVPTSITGVDINRGQLIVFTSDAACLDGGGLTCCDDVPIADAVRASIAVPGVFRPFFINGRRMVDGGVINNLPADILFMMGAGRVLGIDVGPDSGYAPEVDNIFEILTHSLRVMGQHLEECHSARADYILHCNPPGVGLLDFDKVETSIRTGYQCAKLNLPDIRRAMEANTLRFIAV